MVGGERSIYQDSSGSLRRHSRYFVLGIVVSLWSIGTANVFVIAQEQDTKPSQKQVEAALETAEIASEKADAVPDTVDATPTSGADAASGEPEQLPLQELQDAAKEAEKFAAAALTLLEGFQERATSMMERIKANIELHNLPKGETLENAKQLAQQCADAMDEALSTSAASNCMQHLQAELKKSQEEDKQIIDEVQKDIRKSQAKESEIFLQAATEVNSLLQVASRDVSFKKHVSHDEPGYTIQAEIDRRKNSLLELWRDRKKAEPPQQDGLMNMQLNEKQVSELLYHHSEMLLEKVMRCAAVDDQLFDLFQDGVLNQLASVQPAAASSLLQTDSLAGSSHLTRSSQHPMFKYSERDSRAPYLLALLGVSALLAWGLSTYGNVSYAGDPVDSSQSTAKQD